jgi:CubicO group peptidase (beta-lactamase class C family)
MAKIISFFVLCFPSLLWSNTFSFDSIFSLIPKDFTGQIVIKKEKEILFKENFGPKERILGSQINDSTQFNIGEISHTIIYYFFENLFKQNQLKQTECVNRFIKDFPFENIQIKHLLEHKSGLPNLYVKLYHRKVYNNWNLKLAERSVRFSNKDILDIITKKEIKLEFTPGDSMAYSDINYLILASLIEQITGISFPNYTRKIFANQFLFQPTISASTDSIFNKAFGYKQFQDSTFQLCDNLKSIGLPYNDGTYGNQHIYFSALNLATWGQFIFSKKNTAIKNNINKKEIMGGLKFDENFKTISKTGKFGGITSKLIFIPKNQIVIAMNSSVLKSFNPREILNPIIKYLSKLD